MGSMTQEEINTDLFDECLLLKKRIRELEEAIREATGACPEWDTLEPCLSDWCLVLRTALLEKHSQSG